MTSFSFDPYQTGLRKILKRYEELFLRYIWEIGEEGANSGEVWKYVKDRLEKGRSISRAFIIIFLNKMVDQGVFSFRVATGKGGHHRVYIPKLDETKYIKLLLRTIIDSMMRDFPKETSDVLREYLDM